MDFVVAVPSHWSSLSSSMEANDPPGSGALPMLSSGHDQCYPHHFLLEVQKVSY